MLYACNTFNVSIILILSEKHQGASYRKQVNSKFSSDTEEKIIGEIIKYLDDEL